MIKFFTVLMSLQLIIAPVALAQDKGDQFRSNADGKTKMDITGQVTTMAISAVGTATMSCPMLPPAPSVILFAAGSLAYVASEVMGGKDQDKFHNKKMADMEMLEEKLKGTGAGGGGEVQKETLEMALEEEKDLLAIINKRKKWTNTVTTMYKAAAALAAIELAISLIPGAPKFIVSCNAGLLTGTAGLVQKALVGAWAFTKVTKGDMLGGLAVAVGAAIPAVGVPISIALKTPASRIATFAVASMLVGKAKSDLDAEATTAQSNIQKLESVLAQFNSDTFVNGSTASLDTSGPQNSGGVTSGSGSGLASGGNDLSGSNTSSALSSTSPSALPTGDSTRSVDCFTQTSQGIDYSSNCVNPLVIGEPSFDPRIQIPTLRDVTTQSLKMTNAIARGDIAGADAAASGIDALSGKVKDLESSLKKKANERLVASGEKAIDFAKEEKEFASQIDAAVSKSGLSNSSGALAALSSGLSDSSSANGSNDDRNASDITTASSAEFINIDGAGKGQSADGLFGNINEGGLSNSESSISEGDLSAAKSLEESLNDYETSVNDISNRSEDSIFKQVSMRYRANYDRFFERKKPEPEASK